MEKRIEAIENALRDRYMSAAGNSFVLTMKATGNILTVKRVSTGPYRSCGHWHGSRSHIEVVSSSGETKHFKSFETLAKAMAYGIVQ